MPPGRGGKSLVTIRVLCIAADLIQTVLTGAPGRASRLAHSGQRGDVPPRPRAGVAGAVAAAAGRLAPHARTDAAFTAVPLFTTTRVSGDGPGVS
ncbi:hypothetical protein ALMP_45520 [Streptomyces sp. A012304]|nr:hypothetical protein ALMP_45520 [Streptomyces sp. A012304]